MKDTTEAEKKKKKKKKKNKKKKSKSSRKKRNESSESESDSDSDSFIDDIADAIEHTNLDTEADRQLKQLAEIQKELDELRRGSSEGEDDLFPPSNQEAVSDGDKKKVYK